MTNGDVYKAATENALIENFLSGGHSFRIHLIIEEFHIYDIYAICQKLKSGRLSTFKRTIEDET